MFSFFYQQFFGPLFYCSLISYFLSSSPFVITFFFPFLKTGRVSSLYWFDLYIKWETLRMSQFVFRNTMWLNTISQSWYKNCFMMLFGNVHLYFDMSGDGASPLEESPDVTVTCPYCITYCIRHFKVQGVLWSVDTNWQQEGKDLPEERW